MQVIKRDGKTELFCVEKITARLRELCVAQKIKCAYTLVVNKVVSGIHNLITTTEIDKLSAQEAVSMVLNSSEYGRLAAAISVSNLHKSTGTFLQTSKLLRETGQSCPEYDSLIELYGEQLESSIDYDADYLNTYCAIETAITVTLAKIANKVIERPQSNLMRVSLYMHGHDTESVLKCYKLMSKKHCIHGTPVHIDAGLGNRMSSCYLINLDLSQATKERSEIDIFYQRLREAAKISNGSGGIGFSCSSIPATGTPKKNGGKNVGIIQALKLWDEMSAHSVNAGRKSAISPYLEVWHDDVELFIQSKLPHRKDELRCSRLFPALWVPDLFMERALKGEEWSLFCPLTAKDLDNCYGEDFEQLYLQYEREGKYIRKISAASLWYLICRTIEEAGGPFILYKDNCNRLANLSHWGCIKSSNLCTEIMQYSSDTETGVCNLGSVSLPSCVVDGKFDHDLLHEITCQLVSNCNRIIQKSKHPLESATLSNSIHQTMGVGIAGLADTFASLRLPFSSPEARQLNIEIMETIYYSFLKTSCEIAQVEGKHTSYEGSKLSRGILNYMQYEGVQPTSRWPFKQLEKDIPRLGVAHGLGVALMPTSNASINLDTNESFEPYTGNIYVRRSAGGEFMVINRYLEQDLRTLDLWTPDVKDHILKNSGSVAGLDEVPEHIRELYKTAFEVPMKDQADMVHDRMPWVDQSQSFTSFFKETSIEKISNFLVYCWLLKFKTGVYYTRTEASLGADIIGSSIVKEEGCIECVV
ncbi:Ribonucleoside-diphosphate reductase large subunit [uncultured virus]|nr:Ribonucleoside-diphosphate reductase large subunit [uncultured virus]